MRIITGKYKFRSVRLGNKLKFSPILSSVRESIFNILNFKISWPTTIVADIFSGSGILGLESLSRDAKFCYFNDLDSRNVAAIDQYLTKFKANNAQTSNLPYQQFLNQCRQLKVKLGLVFVTPPYNRVSYATETLELLLKNHLLDPNACVVVQLDKPFNFINSTLPLIAERKYGRTHIYFFRFLNKIVPSLLNLHNQKLLIISGPSGVGKKSIVNGLINETKLNLAYSISSTTRKKRLQEINHHDYHFLTKTEFETEIAKKNFLEYADYLGNYYGTSLRHVQTLINDKKNVLLETEIEGAMIIKKQFPDAIWIFIYPPNMQELEERITNRGTENQIEIVQRLNKTKTEMEFVFQQKKCDFYVENKTLTKTISDIKKFLNKKWVNV